MCGKQFGIRMVLGLLLLLLGGATYTVLENGTLQRRYAAPGQFYVVNGYPMHLYCVGSGTPAVILESGLGNDWLGWQKGQGQLAQTNSSHEYEACPSPLCGWG